MILLNKNEISFPDPEFFGNSDGLIAIGGDLSIERVLFAYQNGIFPWYNPGEEILWWCPDPRFVLFPTDLKVSKSMKKILKNEVFTFTENQSFRAVVENCKKIEREGQDGTWISDELMESFEKLYHLGHAKSVEVWQNNELVGGFYGLQIGTVFCGESMFAKVSNASKAGFIYWVSKYKKEFTMIDCQVQSPHLESLGAQLIPKKDFLQQLKKAQNES